LRGNDFLGRAVGADELIVEYGRLRFIADALGGGPGRATTLGWDLEYTSPHALCAFVDQILFRRMNDFVPDGDRPLILDCGANIGYTVLHYKRQFPAARIIAFEPDPQFAPILRRNLDRNGASDVEIVEAAAWTADGRVPWVMEGTDGSRIRSDGHGDAERVDVRAVDLARYLGQDVDLLKLDVEGAEFAIVPHIAPGLRRVKNILVECHLLDQSAYAGLSRLLTTLQGAGFTMSLNSYGPWRDLTRRHTPRPLHAEQYMLLAGWRADAPGVAREETFVPYVGLPQRKQIIGAVEQQRDAVTRALAGLALNPEAWTVYRLGPRFRHDGGACWTWRFPQPAPAGDAIDRADAATIVMEDDRALGPGHSLHEDIRTIGRGRFSHWGPGLYLSTSDNSNPNTNGRCYTAICRRPVLRPGEADAASAAGDDARAARP
jgi:FkbM family methyltransferase